MRNKRNRKGFSLVEVLMAVGIMATGMLFVAGVFPVAVHYTTVTAERTTAAVVADEAFAKIKLYGMDFNDIDWPWEPPGDVNNGLIRMDTSINYLHVFPYRDYWYGNFYDTELAYPSTTEFWGEKKYYWSAICRYAGNFDKRHYVQVTVFVSRITGVAKDYFDFDMHQAWEDSLRTDGLIPAAIPAKVIQPGSNSYELEIIDRNSSDDSREETFFNEGATIIDNRTGQLYRVLERYAADPPLIIRLDRPWPWGTNPGSVWVIPPPVQGGRYPCIGVFQKVMSFYDATL